LTALNWLKSEIKEKEEIKINYEWYNNPERAKRLSEGK